MKLDMKAIAEALVTQVRSYVDQSLAGVLERLAALESREVRDGKDGVDGRDGAPGKDGADGAPGASVYDLARAAGFEGSEADFLLAQRGEPGKDGRDGRDGRDGKDGADGQDAADLHVLSAIDEARSYQKGTWASHRGGLWVARRSTEGMDGWECVVNGLADLEAVMAGERTLSLSCTLSDGRTVAREFSVPVLIDRGVYRPGMLAKAGDAVSFGGSLWVAQRDTDEKPAGEESGWRLAVKRGRDGKDGTNGKDGKDGLNGKDWTGSRRVE